MSSKAGSSGGDRAAGPAARPLGNAGHIKGAAFREFLRWFESTRGVDALREAANRLSPSERGLLMPERPVLGVLVSTWYPARTVHRLLDELSAGLSAGQRNELARDGARAVIEATLSGIYRTLFELLATPERYARFAGRLWSAYYDAGSFTVVNRATHEAECTIAHWPTHHPLICDLNWYAARYIYEAMGCRGVQVARERCVSAGDRDCFFRTRWVNRVG
jgi:hypothetical protein